MQIVPQPSSRFREKLSWRLAGLDGYQVIRSVKVPEKLGVFGCQNSLDGWSRKR